jgi:hypothetical protein
MTKDKAQKQAVRTRMARTGERYSTARHYLLDLHRQEDANAEFAPLVGADSPDAAETTLPPRAADPGVSDAAVQRATGRSWDAWFTLLDAWQGTSHTHAEIARHLYETYGIDGWWAQSVTVGYERARGMRALHERPDGFSMNASKTFPVPVERLFAAFVDPDERERWLEAVELRDRTSQPHKSARFDILPGETRLAVTFVAKGPRKAAAQLQQDRLGSAEEVARWKTLWKEQLDLLAVMLAEEP